MTPITLNDRRLLKKMRISIESDIAPDAHIKDLERSNARLVWMLALVSWGFVLAVSGLILVAVYRWGGCGK